MTSNKNNRKQELFDKEFLPHIDALYNFGLRLTLDTEDAKDLVQNVYLKAFRFIDTFKPESNAKAWLFKILKNSFINDFRKQKKEGIKVEYNEITNVVVHDAPEAYSTMDAQALEALLGDEVSTALNQLDENYRTVIILCDINGFKYEEIAEIVEVPVGTVRSRLHRARHLLKIKLMDYGKKLGYT